MYCDAQVQHGAPVSCGAATITAAVVDLKTDGASDPLQQPQIGQAAPVQFSTPSVSFAAPVPVQYAALFTNAATPAMTVARIDLNRDDCDAQVQYGGPISYGTTTITVPAVDLSRDGTPDAMHQPPFSYASLVRFSTPAMCYATPASVQYAAPVANATMRATPSQRSPRTRVASLMWHSLHLPESAPTLQVRRQGKISGRSHSSLVCQRACHQRSSRCRRQNSLLCKTCVPPTNLPMAVLGVGS